MNFFIKTSSNLYIFWNIGSIMMMSMMIQISIGFMLSMFYFFYSNDMFINSFFIYYNINYGWLMRFTHSNLTSLIFILVFIHMTRSLIYKNYMSMKMWYSGMLMLLLLMMISFLGYSLIWSQMAYWASMVITNFIAIIPIIGNKIMLLIWGNQFINNILMNRFFSIHFISAMIIMVMMIIHMIILHINKSTNPLSINNNIDQINLNPLLIFKDMLMMIMFIYILLMINMLMPLKMNNPDNFNQMMMFKTPAHIEPEWYFLFFYSILRSINNKLNGLLMMTISIMIWFIVPLINKTKFLSSKFILIHKISLMMLITVISIITYIGSKPSKPPYTMIMKFIIISYFSMFKYMFTFSKLMNKIF